MSLIGINMAKIKGILGRFHASGDMKVKKNICYIINYLVNDIVEYILCHNLNIFYKYLLSKYDFGGNIH